MSGRNLIVVVALFAATCVQSVIVNAEGFGQTCNAGVDLALKGGVEYIYTGKVPSLRSHLGFDVDVSLQTGSGAILEEWSLPAYGQLVLDVDVPAGTYWIVVEDDSFDEPMSFEVHL